MAELDGLAVNIAFYVLSVMTLTAAGGVMLSRNLFHAVLFLILSFVGHRRVFRAAFGRIPRDRAGDHLRRRDFGAGALRGAPHPARRT